MIKRIGFWLPILFTLSIFTFSFFFPVSSVLWMSCIAFWMAVWWMTEAVPLSVTAMLPLVFFPLFGISSGKSTSVFYMNHLIFLFIGGFLVAIAMQECNLHKRVALWILSRFGKSPDTILLSFMGVTWFLSMWVSNTATAMMMVPIAISVVNELKQLSHKFATAIFLGVAYSASIGGISTLVGTPPNLSFVRIFEISFPEIPTVTFAQWLGWIFPLSLIMLFLAWGVLRIKYVKETPRFTLSHFYKLYNELPSISYEEKVVGFAFISMALLWISRSVWEGYLPYPDFINDGSIAITISLVLFLIPAKNNQGCILNNSAFHKLPWDIVLLFGGGFALASGFIESGLSEQIGYFLQSFSGVPSTILVGTICFFITFLTELTSNTATIELILPLLASMAQITKIDPLLLMVPATLSASCAFMLPVATPPNAIVFGSGYIKIKDMVQTGLVLNCLGILFITGVIRLIF